MLSLKNKTGGEKYLSIWWFAILVVIATGIVVGVLMYYSADADIRELEAGSLSKVLDSCVVHNGILDKNVLSKDFNVFSECNLKKSLFQKGSDFYFKVSFLDNTGKNLREDIIEGNAAFLPDCEVLKKEGAKKTIATEYPECSFADFYFIYYEKGESKIGTLQLVTASNQKGVKETK